jgi:hypothetical protein
VNLKEKKMERLVRRMTLLALASVSLLATTANAQNPATVTDTYAAKFICGVQKDPNIALVPDAQAGNYSTKINVHNNTGLPSTFARR